MTYPSPKERLIIINKRRQLLKELNSILAKPNTIKQYPEIDHLNNKYGMSEVQRMLDIIKKQFQVKSIEDDTIMVYKQYIENYRRFGGQRPLIDFKTFNELNLEFTKLFGKKLFGQLLSTNQQRRLDELTDLMFKESIFWDDITHEEPPAKIPDIDFSNLKVSDIPKTSDVSKTISLAQGKVPACERDGFPMLIINGRLECVVEYLDRYIGQQKIIDVIKQGEIYYYVFANGYQLPLLCFCCNRPLVISNLIKTRQNMLGRRLVAMAMETKRFENGQELEELILQFSKKGILSKEEELGVSFEEELGVSFEVAVYLKHSLTSSEKIVKDISHGYKKKKTARKKKRKK